MPIVRISLCRKIGTRVYLTIVEHTLVYKLISLNPCLFLTQEEVHTVIDIIQLTFHTQVSVIIKLYYTLKISHTYFWRAIFNNWIIIIILHVDFINWEVINNRICNTKEVLILNMLID